MIWISKKNFDMLWILTVSGMIKDYKQWELLMFFLTTFDRLRALHAGCIVQCSADTNLWVVTPYLPAALTLHMTAHTFPMCLMPISGRMPYCANVCNQHSCFSESSNRFYWLFSWLSPSNVWEKEDPYDWLTIPEILVAGSSCILTWVLKRTHPLTSNAHLL